MELNDYLLLRWSKSNHIKYLKYFNIWLNGLTPIQIYYYTEEFNNYIKYPERFKHY